MACLAARAFLSSGLPPATSDAGPHRSMWPNLLSLMLSSAAHPRSSALKVRLKIGSVLSPLSCSSPLASFAYTDAADGGQRYAPLLAFLLVRLRSSRRWFLRSSVITNLAS